MSKKLFDLTRSISSRFNSLDEDTVTRVFQTNNLLWCEAIELLGVHETYIRSVNENSGSQRDRVGTARCVEREIRNGDIYHKERKTSESTLGRIFVTSNKRSALRSHFHEYAMYIHVSYLLTGIAREVGDVNRHGVQHSHDTRSTLVENTASNCRETLILHGIGIAGNTNLVTESVHDRGIVSTSAKTCQGEDHDDERVNQETQYR